MLCMVQQSSAMFRVAHAGVPATPAIPHASAIKLRLGSRLGQTPGSWPPG